MTSLSRPTWFQRLDRVDAAAIGVVAALMASTAVMLAVPGFDGHFSAPGLDLALDTTATVVTAMVAVLAWVRYAEHREPVAHAESAAFLALAMVNGVAVVVAVNSYPGANEGFVHGGQAQAYVFTAGRILAASLLVFGGISWLRGGRPRFPMAMLVAPVVVIGLVISVVVTLGDQLPALVVGTPSPADPSHASTTPLGAAVQLSGAIATIVAAVVWYRLWRRDGAVSHAYVMIGLIIASFAQLHTVIWPALHPLQVSSGDLLWLAFGVVLILATEAGARTTLAELRKANSSLEELREVEIDRAALEERTRLSRELHDGLAQDLWLARLKAGRLATTPSLGAEATVLTDELTRAIDAGLAGARHAVMALRQGTGGTRAPLCELMHQFVDDFADRFGVLAEFDCDHSAPQLNHRVEAEVLRIAQEALTNVRQHADATLVRVRFETRDGIVKVAVGDNGRGFDPARVGDGGYGLAGMRERAALIHGQLVIDSRPHDGTRVTLRVPVDGAVSGGQGGT